MLRFRPLIGAIAAIAVLALPAVNAGAQGVTTGGLTGIVTDSAGKPIEAAQIQIRNAATGANIGTQARGSGLYVIQGIEPNTGYIVTVRALGYRPISRDGISITLNQIRREDFVMAKAVAQLTEISVTASAVDYVINTSKTGTGSVISDSALRRMPTLNRNFADFVASVPQVSTTTGFLSGGGVNVRQNTIQIDGAQATDLFGLGTTGQAGSSANAKSIPLDAVKEYQVLLSPFDVRQGSFGGLLINAVTKSGTNNFHGSAFGYTRSQSLTRTQPYLTDFSQQQFGGSLGGPIIKNKLFFFASYEQQQLKTPAAGSYFGATSPIAPYVTQAQVDQLAQTLSSKYGITDIGGGDRVQKENPLKNLFVRVDANLPWNTRMVLRHNFAKADNQVFSRDLPTSSTLLYRLTSNSYLLSNKTNSSVIELLSNLPHGVYNEFLANYSTTKDFRTVPVNFPQLTIRGLPRSDTTGTANVVVGTEASSQGNSLDQRTIELTDNITIPIGTHSITIGGKMLKYRSINLFAANSLSSWTFASLDALNNGVASGYVKSAPAPTDPYAGLATINAKSLTAYAADQWQVTPELSLNVGVRVDKPVFDNLPPYNRSVDSVYGRRTDVVAHNAQISPRLGFNWDVTGDKQNQLRGGVGSFSGPTPFVYLSNEFGNSGLSGFGSISCSGAAPTNVSTTPGLGIPAFTPANIASPPLQCLDQTRPNGQVVTGAAISGPAANAAVNTIDPNFKNPKYLKASLGFDHRFSNGFVATLEGLYTRSQNNAFYQDLTLGDPVGTDRNGRTLYGILTNAGVTPTRHGGRLTVLDVTNASGDYTYNVTAQLQKAFTSNFEASVAYSHQASKDVVSLTSSTAGSLYRFQRDVSGDILDKKISKSKYDQPHRIIASGSYHFKTFTDATFTYSGNSGAPFDFTYASNGGTTGDLNGDGQTANDLMYVPKNATDQNEILFSGFNSTVQATKETAAASATAFENLIANTPCLNSQRGTIMTRNSCRNPWVNEVDITVAQSLGKLGGKWFKNVQARFDVINFTNLLNKKWGAQRFSDQGSTCGQICSATTALTHVGNLSPDLVTPISTQTGNPLARQVFTFPSTYKVFNSNNASSNYRMQLSLRYSF
ncbi:MAG: carboxypeptidase regulatory-like domain-containing protein [Gemmatimonadaceae bacterium]